MWRIDKNEALGLFGRRKSRRDVWSKSSWAEKNAFVRDVLKHAIIEYVQNNIVLIEDYLRQKIAEIELDESWPKWKSLNPDFVALMEAAQKEANTIKGIVNQAKQGKDVTFLINNANLQFLTKDEVTQLVLQNTSTNVNNYGGEVNTDNMAKMPAGFLTPIIEFIKENPLYAFLGLGSLGISLFLFSGGSNNNNQNKIETKQLT